MLEFAQYEFELTRKLEDGYSKKEHLLAAWRSTGVMPQELVDAPGQPEQLAYLWGFFLDLSRQRTNNGFGMLPLQYGDIWAWTRLNQQPLDRWELDAILRLDGAYTASMNKPKKVSENVN